MNPLIVHITNQTRTLIHLPPIPGNPLYMTGPRLIPGLNRVPTQYMDALKDYTAPVFDAGGRPVTTEVDVQTKDEKGKLVTYREKQAVVRYPGRDALAELTERKVRLVGPRGAFMGPQLVIHAEGTIDENAPEGPLPPETLPENEAHAEKIVEACSDRELLTRWLRDERRDAVSKAIRARLGSL